MSYTLLGRNVARNSACECAVRICTLTVHSGSRQIDSSLILTNDVLQTGKTLFLSERSRYFFVTEIRCSVFLFL